MTWDAEQAKKILDSRDNCYFVAPARGKSSLKKTHRYQFGRGDARKHLALARERNEGVVTAYLNANSLNGNRFALNKIAGVEVAEFYPKGHIGYTGDHGIAASVAGLETLNPKENDVLRLSVEGPSAFKNLVDWYAGLRDFPISDGIDVISPSHSEGEGKSNPSFGVDELEIDTEESDTGSEVSCDFVPDDREISSTSYMSDPMKRCVVERVAVDQAKAYYAAQGFNIEEKGKPYDLLCLKGTLIVHVEVKGTTGCGNKVFLTRNEIADAKNPEWRSDLFIVHGIQLVCNEGTWVGSGGARLLFEGWMPNDEDLEPIQYEYLVPKV